MYYCGRHNDNRGIANAQAIAAAQTASRVAADDLRKVTLKKAARISRTALFNPARPAKQQDLRRFPREALRKGAAVALAALFPCLFDEFAHARQLIGRGHLFARQMRGQRLVHRTAEESVQHMLQRLDPRPRFGLGG